MIFKTSADGPTTDSRAEQDTILVVEDLTKRFGGLIAVDALSFTVREGEILGFIGPNGAGKSTTFNCITGFHKPTSGRIEFQGTDITGWPKDRVVKCGISRTFQNFRPLSDRSVVENVELSLVKDNPFTFKGLVGKTHNEAETICERVGLGERLNQLPDELPHAGLLRLELARALATDPTLLLVDEPFAGLARTEVMEISDLLRDFNDEGHTIVVVDHNMRGLLPLVDRVIVIQFGDKIAEGVPQVIKEDPVVQKAYLGGDEL